MIEFAVLGPGGVGGFLAAALARNGQSVTIVARQETAAQLNRAGLRIRSARLGDFHVSVPASTTLEQQAQALIVATKAVGLEDALARIEATPDLVVPLLNGLEHMDLLRSRFGPDRVAAGTIRIESDRPEPGLIVQTSPFLRVDLAAELPGAAAVLPDLARQLESAGIPCRLEESEANVLWSKLVRLVALAITTSAADAPIGTIRSDPQWRRRLVEVIAEAAAVAHADGAPIDPAERVRELDEAHPGLGSSMQRDIAAGRTPELDAIAGGVLRAARRHGIDCPVLTELAAQVARRAGVPAPRA